MKKPIGYLNIDFLKYPVEEKLLVLIPWLASFLTGICAIEGFFLNDTFFVIACTISTLIFIVTYILIRVKRNLKITAWIMVLNTLLLTNVVWFRFEGSQGGSTPMFLVLFFCITFFFKNIGKGIAFSIVLINLFALFYVEYNYPFLIKPYDSQFMRMADLLITFSVCGVFLVFVVHCILKSYYQERAKSEQVDKLKHAFLTNISHELRTPLNAILGFTNLMNQPKTSEDERKAYAKFVADSCKSLTNMVDEMIEIAQIESNQKKIQRVKCNITDLLEHVYYHVKRSPEKGNKKDVDLVLDRSLLEKDVIIDTDPTLLKQVLLNLIDNALKFTSKGFIKFGYNLRKTHLLFYVKDTGIGIPENERDQVFDNFTKGQNSTNELYRGVGLGLALSKRILHLLLGKIWFVSTINQGSTFYFTIPYNDIEITDQRYRGRSN